MKKLSIILTLVFFLAPSTTFASVIFNNYTCASNWTGSWAVGSVTCSSNTVIFTTADSQQASNNGTGNTLIDISNGGAGQTVYITLTNSSSSGTIKAWCGGSVTNCTKVNISAGANNEVSMVVPVESGGGNFAYLILDNNSATASGSISNICIDNDGTSCTPAATSTVNRLAKFTTTTQTLGDSLFSDDGSNTTLTAGNLFMQIGSLIDTVTSGALNFGTTNATTMTFGRSGQNAIFNSNVGIATSTPGSLFSIGGIVNFTTATTTFYGNGIDIPANQCYAISGVCLSASGGGVSSIAQTYGTGQTGAITLATSSTAYNGLTVNERIINSASAFTFSPVLSGTLGVGGGGTGVGTLTGLLQGNGTSNITAITGTSGQIPYYNNTNTLGATSTISISTGGFVTIGTTTATKMLNLGNDNGIANGSTTIKMGKIQFDGYNSAGARRCVFLNSSNTFTSSAGACK